MGTHALGVGTSSIDVTITDARGASVKAAGTAVIAGVLSYEVAKTISLDGSRSRDLLSLALVSVTWGAAVAAGLSLLRSELPRDLRRRKPTAYPRVAERQAEETMSSGNQP